MRWYEDQTIKQRWRQPGWSEETLSSNSLSSIFALCFSFSLTSSQTLVLPTSCCVTSSACTVVISKLPFMWRCLSARSPNTSISFTPALIWYLKVKYTNSDLQLLSRWLPFMHSKPLLHFTTWWIFNYSAELVFSKLSQETLSKAFLWVPIVCKLNPSRFCFTLPLQKRWTRAKRGSMKLLKPPEANDKEWYSMDVTTESVIYVWLCFTKVECYGPDLENRPQNPIKILFTLY